MILQRLRKSIADFNASDSLTTYLDYPQGHSVDFWRGIAYLGANDYDNQLLFGINILPKKQKTLAKNG